MRVHVLKRLLVGEPLSTAQARHERLSKVTGLAIFAPTTSEILRVLIIAGPAALNLSTPIAILTGRPGKNVVTMVIPEFIPARWWQHLLHNQTALLIKGALLFRCNVSSRTCPTT